MSCRNCSCPECARAYNTIGLGATGIGDSGELEKYRKARIVAINRQPDSFIENVSQETRDAQIRDLFLGLKNHKELLIAHCARLDSLNDRLNELQLLLE